MFFINFLIFLLISAVAIPVTVFFVQVVASLLYKKKDHQGSLSFETLSVAVLIPAHDESLNISDTISSILPQLKITDQLLVVADNCKDDTAFIANSLGAQVVERTNTSQRGKGYALDFGLQALGNKPPQIVIIIDADCVISENLIKRLSLACNFHQAPIQALYLMGSTNMTSLKSRVAEFAWLVKNKVRPLGFAALGLPCQLMGTGMAFLWSDIVNIPMANGHIAEDMLLGVNLSRANKSPLFLPDVQVSSQFPNSQPAETTQRTRWEHGHMSLILSEAPALFIESIKKRNLKMLGLALDLIVPPLAVLALSTTLLFVLILGFHFFLPMNWLVFYITFIQLILISSVMLAWLFFGRQVISLKQLCYAPIYALNKIPLYIKFFIDRQVEWVRSKRD